MDTDQNSLITDLKDSLKKLVNDSKQIRVKVLQVTRSENESSLVARSIGDQLEKRVAFKKAIRQTTQMLQKVALKVLKFKLLVV